MIGGIISYDRPREKIQLRGVGSLSDGELLRTLIGSGNAHASASRIAKRTLKLLRQCGSSVTYEQLQTISGLGSARISAILAGFELASRYPVPDRRAVLDSIEKVHQQLITDQVEGLVYLTLDGAQRLIVKRTLRVGRDKPEGVLRRLFADVLKDKANEVIIGRFHNDRLLIPAMNDLALARGLKQSALLFGISKMNYIIFNAKDQHSIMNDA